MLLKSFVIVTEETLLQKVHQENSFLPSKASSIFMNIVWNAIILIYGSTSVNLSFCRYNGLWPVAQHLDYTTHLKNFAVWGLKVKICKISVSCVASFNCSIILTAFVADCYLGGKIVPYVDDKSKMMTVHPAKVRHRYVTYYELLYTNINNHHFENAVQKKAENMKWLYKITILAFKSLIPQKKL